MDHYVSDPIPLPPRDEEQEITRADLVFYGVGHRGSSYEGRIFFNAPDAGPTTAMELDAGYAGSFTVFGHGGCYGDVGHCDVPTEPTTDAFDLRPPHPLTPYNLSVIVTEALKRVDGDQVTVTVVPVVPGDEQPETEDVLEFDGMRLVSYEDSA